MKFGQYELLERVAVGGMAEVYRGRTAGAEGFEKWVAIKRILPEFARDERFISMMLTEARIHSALSHRNIVQIHDLGISEDGEYFIVLEYVEGHDLRAVMEAAAELGVQIPDSLALHVADELAQALHFAHELKDSEGQPLGIIHRDVSPSNVLISNAGEVKLSDFGIAKRRNDHSFVGSLKGNLAYMSPEQARRVPLDRRTDVFSLGAVLFEMLTGQKVREIADEVTGFRDVASGVVRSARSLRPDLPEAYEALLMGALASEPADRYPDAAAFGAAIRELGRENAAPVGPAEMKELVELLNPPRRARSPVERSKVIRLGPEFKALAGPARNAKSPAPSEPPVTEIPPVILAPGIAAAGVPAAHVNGNGGPRTPGWVDSAARFAAATPPPRATQPLPATAAASTQRAQPLRPPLASAPSANVATPPPPVLLAQGAPPPVTSEKANSGAPSAHFDAADAAIHALEFSSGNEMQPTPPPPAVQGPYAPDVVTPMAAPIPGGAPPSPVIEGSPLLSATGSPVALPGPSLVAAPTSMGHEMAATPPPRAGTYPGLGSGPNLASGPGSQGWTGPGTASGLGPGFVGSATDSVRPNARMSASFSTSGAAITMTFPAVKKRKAWPTVVVVLVALASGGAAVAHYKVMPLNVLAVWFKPASLKINSDPVGAKVTLDGHAVPGATPTEVEIRRDRTDHVLEFTREGSLPLRSTIRFDRSVALSETVTLPAAPPPPPPPAPPPVEVAPPPPIAAEPPPSPKPQTKAEKRAARKAARLSAKKPSAKQSARKEAKRKAKKKSKKSASRSTATTTESADL